MTDRREFIKKISAAAAVALAGDTFAMMPVQKTKRRGVALVGLGYYSTDLLGPALQLTEKCYLAGIVTGTPSKAERWKQQYRIPEKNIYNYTNFDDIANNDDIDVVYVVLPPSLHATFSIRAANAGKHVWCEKPMALTANECTSMIDACAKNKVKLSIGYRMQHEPNTQQIIKYRKDLRYGKILNVEAAAGYYDPRSNHWKQKKKMGGGAMYDMGVYPLNATRYTTGMEPIAVTAQQSTSRPQFYTEVDETTSFQLEFPNGITAKCETSLGKSINDLKVTCEKGWYRLSPFQSYSGINGITSDGIKLDQIIPNQQARQMDDDATAIIENKAVLVPGEEGMRDIRVVEAVHRSAREQKRIEISR